MKLWLEMGEEPFGSARTLPFCALRKFCQNDLFFFLSHLPAVRNKVLNSANVLTACFKNIKVKKNERCFFSMTLKDFISKSFVDKY